VKILDEEKLRDFGNHHADARKRLSKWRSAVEAGTWVTPVEMQKAFPSLDVVGPQTVFDIGSNRIITVIDYAEQIVLVDYVLTHDVYMKEKWKR
jgi:mRNA-degrading endonuclease HigB of HigAB toxin-antitoxin module